MQEELAALIRLDPSTVAVGPAFLGLALGASAPAVALSDRRRECGDRDQAVKAANKLHGQSWPDYREACNASLEAPARAAPRQN
jgi:hypothetical protein